MQIKFLMAILILMSVTFNSMFASEFQAPAKGDFSRMSWSAAFEALHEKISVEYAFTEWKGIDWPKLRKRYGRLIKRAEKKKLVFEYEKALKEYVLSLPDGHVSIQGGNYDNYGGAYLQGSYGLTLTALEDGKVIASYVAEDSSAEEAGIKAGAEIISWEHKKTAKALAKCRTIWLADSGLATDTNLCLKRCRKLARDLVGSSVKVTYINSEAEANHAKPVTVTLTAYDDRFFLLGKANFAAQSDGKPPTVEYKMLSGKCGYILVKAILDLEALQQGIATPEIIYGNVYNKFKQAVQYMLENDAVGVIIDLRGNLGGCDQLAAQLAGFFHQQKMFYERQSLFNALTEEFELRTENDYTDEIIDALYIEPQAPYFDKPVIAIVDPGTLSSGEGVAMGIQNAPNGHVLGFYGTNGSFGMTGGEILMPGGITIKYPNGRSLDAAGVIQLDSRNGIGGVTPDFIIPMTVENAVRFANGEDVLLEKAQEKMDGLSRKK